MLSLTPRQVAAAVALAASLASYSVPSQAHVVLPAGGAAAGSVYRANFIIGHACKGASTTTGLTVTLPTGFTLTSAEPRPGWKVTSIGNQVTWASDSPTDGLAGAAPATLSLSGKLSSTPTTLWFPVRQTCDVGSADWATVPSAADPKPQFPAPHLDVWPDGVAAVDSRGAWAQPTVAGQRSTSVFVRLTAPSGARLLGASSPAGSAALHQMRMDGDVMRMRELPDGIDLPPGQPVDLTPNTLHIMVVGLTRPLEVGSVLPLTLHFADREGRHGDLSLQVPVGGAPALQEHHHEAP